jgi:DnaJ-class molecular chaperone
MDDDLMIRIAALHAALGVIDYYSLLSVGRTFAEADLREAYYRFAAELHPDNFRDSAPDVRSKVYEIFKRAAEGYRVLGHPQLRSAYDEGLSRGEIRLRTEEQPRSAEPAEPVFQSLAAKQFWRQGIEAESTGDLKRAKLSFTMVLGLEQGNEQVKARLEEVDRRMKESRK